MAIDSVSARYQAYDDALKELEPQIRGLQDKVNDTLSEELRSVLQERLNYLQTIANQISVARSTQQTADNALTTLEGGGGFPTVPDMEIPANLMEELDREGADDAAARGGFTPSTAPPQAEKVTLNLGKAQDI